MCWQYDQAFQATYDTCFTTALEGNQVTWYQTDGTIIYPARGRPKLIKGNPENLWDYKVGFGQLIETAADSCSLAVAFQRQFWENCRLIRGYQRQ